MPLISREKENIFSDNQDSLLATGDQGNNNQKIFQLEKCEFTGKSWNSRHNVKTGSVLINVIKNPLQRPQLWLLDLGLPPKHEPAGSQLQLPGYGRDAWVPWHTFLACPAPAAPTPEVLGGGGQ